MCTIDPLGTRKPECSRVMGKVLVRVSERLEWWPILAVVAAVGVFGARVSCRQCPAGLQS